METFGSIEVKKRKADSEQTKTELKKVKINESVQFHAKAPESPKKRLDYDKSSSKEKNKLKFIYGNYTKYYGYRNKNERDVRLEIFEQYKDLFTGDLLDIGCNTGFITTHLAERFAVKSAIGIDIDKSLINMAFKNLTKIKKSKPRESTTSGKFPHNIRFLHGNYVLKNDVLLECEHEQFDVILCLSITKWIQLNFGDSGLKQAFKRMFLQLRPGGRLIMEAQPFDNYGRRKKMTDTIFANYKAMRLFPQDFNDYLLGDEVGFSRMESMGVPDHVHAGFKRPINIFYKD